MYAAMEAPSDTESDGYTTRFGRGDTMSRPESERLLAKQARRESNARTYPRHLPLAIERAEGVASRTWTETNTTTVSPGPGRSRSGTTTPPSSRPSRRCWTRADRSTRSTSRRRRRSAFVDALFESLPDEFADNARVQFCSPAGTDAIEAALKLVKTATGNRSILAFRAATTA